MKTLLLFCILTLSERFLNINLGYLRLSLGDLFVVSFFIYHLLSGATLPKSMVALLALVFFLLSVSSFSNALIGLNAVVSISLKVFMAFVLVRHERDATYDRRNLMIYGFFITGLILCDLFLTGKLGGTEYFNANELGFYLLGSYFVISAYLIRHERAIGKMSHVAFILFVVFLILNSRQGVLALMGVFVAILVFSNASRLKKGTVIVCFGAILSLAIAPNSQLLNDRNLQRLDTIILLEPSTRADNYRLNNILFGLNGFLEKPLIGHGLTSFLKDSEYKKVAHNAYVTFLYEMGLVGFILYTYFLFFSFTVGRRVIKVYRKVYSSFAIYCFGFWPLSLVIVSLFIEVLAKAPLYLFVFSTFMMYEACNRKVGGL